MCMCSTHVKLIKSHRVSGAQEPACGVTLVGLSMAVSTPTWWGALECRGETGSLPEWRTARGTINSFSTCLHVFGAHVPALRFEPPLRYSLLLCVQYYWRVTHIVHVSWEFTTESSQLLILCSLFISVDVVMTEIDLYSLSIGICVLCDSG